MVNSFDPFLSRLGSIHDPRRAEGKLYQLPYILLFSILAIVTGANSYRGIRTFTKTAHFESAHQFLEGQGDPRRVLPLPTANRAWGHHEDGRGSPPGPRLGVGPRLAWSSTVSPSPTLGLWPLLP